MATAIGARPRLNGERRFHLAMAGLILALVVIGFGPSYYYAPVTGGRPGFVFTPMVHLHGMIFSAWVLLFMAQVGLVSAGQLALHRRMGAIGVALAVAMMVVGTLTALEGVARASGPPIVPPLSWLAVPLFNVPAFGILILAALHFRRDPPVHKRLMVLAMLAMIAPATGRIFTSMIGLAVLPPLLVGIMLVRDLVTRRSIHPATAWGAAIAVAGQLLPLLVWQTGPWLAFAGWAAGLVR